MDSQAVAQQMEISKLLNKQINVAQMECKNLTIQLSRIKQNGRDATLQSLANNCGQSLSTVNLRRYRTLKGHFDKVADIAWLPDGRHIVSASQDGFLLVWDSTNGFKKELIELDDPWVMCCDVSHDGRLVATGGLENACIVYKMSIKGTGPQQQSPLGADGSRKSSLLSVFKGHKEYISGLSFLAGSSSQIVTCSGDRSSILWDTTKGGKVSTFYGHLGDVLSLSPNPTDPNIFVTCSCDRRALLWDKRSPVSVRRYVSADNCDASVVRFFPDGYSFACGSDDGTIKLFDLRSDGDIATYGIENVRQYAMHNNIAPILMSPKSFSSNEEAKIAMGSIAGSMESSLESSIDNPGVISMSFSKSGRLMLTSYAEYSSVMITDTITGQILGSMGGHSDVVSSICVSDDGLGVATGSRDYTVNIWSV